MGREGVLALHLANPGSPAEEGRHQAQQLHRERRRGGGVRGEGGGREVGEGEEGERERRGGGEGRAERRVEEREGEGEREGGR